MKLLLHPSSVRQTRKAAGLSQNKVAAMTGLHVSQVSGIENGSGCHSDTLEKLTNVLLSPVYYVHYCNEDGGVDDNKVNVFGGIAAYKSASTFYHDIKKHWTDVWMTMEVEPEQLPVERAGGAE